MQNYTNKLLGLFVVFALAVALVPTTNAQTSTGTFGSIVKAGDADVTYTYSAAIAAPAYALDFVDDDGDGFLDSDESVYYTITAGAALSVLDIRCANPISGRTAGSFVLGSHSDKPLATSGAMPGAVAFYDADGDGVYDNGEQIYWDTDGSASISVSDVVLSGSGACTLVKSGSTGFNNALTAGPAGFATYAVFDVDGDALFSSADTVYDDIDASGDVSVQDVQVSGTPVGRIVKSGDMDVTYSFNPAIAAPVYVLDFVDDDGDGFLDSDESVYYTTSAGAALSVLDIRCANPITGRTAGSFVLGSHSDKPLATSGAMPGAVAFYDADGDGVYDNGEQIYWDTDGSASVSVSDVILSGSGACTLVKSGTSGFNNALTAGPAGFATYAVFDVDGDALFSSTDIVYDNIDGSVNALGSGTVSVQDVQLSGTSPGRIVKAGDHDVTYTFLAAVAPAYVLDFVDDDGDGFLDSDESVYYTTSAGAALSVLDIRVANPITGRSIGSFVLGSHSDKPLATSGAMPGAVAFYDADGDGVYDNGEQIYWDTDGSASISVSDVVLSGAGAGTLVKSGTSGFNNALVAGAPAGFGTYAVFDVDGDALFSSADAVYDDIDGTGDASVQDVRLTGPAPTKGTNSQGPGPTNSNTNTATTTDTDTSTSTVTTSMNPTTGTQPTTGTEPTGSETDDDDGNQTPGFELVALVAALAVALVLVRRKL